ncbi:MAG: FeoA domain-containing protein [bacterium]
MEGTTDLTGGELPINIFAPLAAVSEGVSVVIKDVKGPPGIALRLAAFGLMPGKKVKMLRNSPGNGPLLLEIDNTRLGLAKSICMNVLTSALDGRSTFEPNEAAEMRGEMAV